jgi:hypothetical protein
MNHSTSSIHSCIENLINGNLTDAKRLAKRHSFTLLRYSAEEEFCFSSEKAVAAAAYLKSDEVSRELAWKAWCAV